MSPPDQPLNAAPSAATTPEARLKRLLLSAELDLIRRLERDNADLAARVGDDDALKHSLQGVIVDVLREAGSRQHERMAGVMAPLVLASLREEIRNSRDMMVDALYPITGRLVAAAVRNAFRDLVETLNQRLDRTLSLERWTIKLQAMATGVSEAELMLRKHPPFTLDELLLIHRPTGLLMARVSESPDDATDGDMVGSMLTAIMAFTREAFGHDKPGELRTLSVGDADLFVRTSPAVILAVRARGTPPAGFDRAFEDLFIAFLDHWGDVLRDFQGNAEEAAGPEVVEDLNERFRALTAVRPTRKRKTPVKALLLLGAVAAALLVWIGIGIVEDRRIEGLERTARDVVAAEPRMAGYPVRVSYDDGTAALVVTGLTPDADARERLHAALAAALPGTPVDLALTPLPDGSDAVLAKLDQRFAAVDAGLRSLSDAVEALDQRVTHLQAWQRATAANLDGLDGMTDRLATVERALADPVAALRRTAAETAVYFGDGAEFRDAAAAAVKLEQVAAALERTPPRVRLRVVGYADALGTPTGQETLSLARAYAVADALDDLGVPAERLITVGRGAARPLVSETGVTSNNRRVEFEVPADGE